MAHNVKFKTTKNNSFYSFSNLKYLYEIIKINDIIHAHLFPSFYLVSLLSLFFQRKKIILTEHNSYNRRRNIKLFKYLDKIIYNRFSSIICISKGVESSLKDWIGVTYDTYVIPNFINVNKIINTSKSKMNFFEGDNNILLCMVGSFSEQKDQLTVINALHHLPSKYKLILIGDGPKKKYIEHIVSKLYLEERIIFLGVRKDVIQILKNCQYGILSSNWEGFGLVALEYMASGLVSIGTNVKGLNEVIPIKENLFNVKDYKSLVARILLLEKDKALKNKVLNIQNTHYKNYDIDLLAKKHQEIYRNI